MEFTKPYSEATAQVIDEELKGLVDELYTRTKVGVLRVMMMAVVMKDRRASGGRAGWVLGGWLGCS
jgi:hypothetical protein